MDGSAIYGEVKARWRGGEGTHGLHVDPVDEQAAALAAAGPVRDGEVRGRERQGQQEHGLRDRKSVV